MTQTADQGTAECKRPGCGSAVPAASGDSGDGDPLAALEQALRQAAVLARTARDQAAALDPAHVRADIADAEAARRRAVTAEARQAEAEAQALAEALQAAHDTAAARDTARQAEETARTLAAELDQLRRGTAAEITAAQENASRQATASSPATSPATATSPRRHPHAAGPDQMSLVIRCAALNGV
jgi:hypothetical protein